MEIPALSHPRIAKRRRTLGKNLAVSRRAKNLSVRAASARLGVSHTTWIRWESGDASPPAELFPDLAKVVDTDVHDLMAMDEAA
jgi:transcriptional regulator with XRE-family HTH domain